MTQSLHPVIKDFYSSILKYAGLMYDDSTNSVININPKMGEITINEKKITLPFIQNLRNPNGRSIFHPLHENYIAPESPLFLLFKKRLVCEINLKLSQLIVSLIHVANSIELQGKINDPDLIELIAAIRGTDITLTENFLTLITKSKLKHDEAFVVDIFLKKNGELKGEPWSATGKVVFNMQTELTYAINDAAKDSRMFGFKLRKKDLNSLQAIFAAVFGDGSQLNEYVTGSDNKVFRYLNVLLSTCYLVTNIINKLAQKLAVIDDNTLAASELTSDHEWVTLLPQVYELTNEIRGIPNQDEMIVEGKTPYRASPVERLNIDESRVTDTSLQAQPQQQVQAPVQQVGQPQFAPVPVQQMAPATSPSSDINDIIKRRSNEVMYGYQYPQQMVQQPVYMPPPQPVATPMWIAAANQLPQPVPQQAVFMNPQFVQPQYPQQMMQPAQFAPQMQMPMQPQQQQFDMFGRPVQYQPMQPFYPQMQQVHQPAVGRQG